MSVDEVMNDLQYPQSEKKRELVEVVRCKNCRIHGLCRFEQMLGLDGFCSHGEKRDG